MEAVERIHPCLPALHRCDRGVSALEFAFAAPILFLLILGMIEIAIVTFVSVSVEGGLKEASRFGITGQQAENEAARRQEILDILARHTLGLVDMAEATITLKSYDSFNDVGQPEPFVDAEPLNQTYDEGEIFEDLNKNGKWDEDRGVDGVGNAGDVVMYRIDYDRKLFTPLVARFIGKNGRVAMSSSVLVRNEPWDLTQSSAGTSN